MLSCRFYATIAGSYCLSRPPKKPNSHSISRRQFFRYCQGASLTFLPSGLPLAFLWPTVEPPQAPSSEGIQVHPQYRVKLGLEELLKKITAGFDEFVNEKYQDEIAVIFELWSTELLASPQGAGAIASALAGSFLGCPLGSAKLQLTFNDGPFRIWAAEYSQSLELQGEAFLAQLRESLSGFTRLFAAEFQITRIQSESAASGGLSIDITMRFELAGTGSDFHREQRIGNWEMNWERSASGEMRIKKWRVTDETRSRSSVPVFVDTASQAFGAIPSYAAQLLPGTDHWRSVIDVASG